MAYMTPGNNPAIATLDMVVSEPVRCALILNRLFKPAISSSSGSLRLLILYWRDLWGSLAVLFEDAFEVVKGEAHHGSRLQEFS